MKSVLTNLLRLLLTLAIIYLLGRQLAHNWPQVVEYNWQIDFLLLPLSIVVQLLMFLLYSKIWCVILEGFGHTVSLPHGFKISYMTNMGRYLPGRIWQVLGMLYLCRKRNIPQSVAFASWGIMLLFSLIASFLAGLIAIFLYPEIISGTLAEFAGPSLYVFAAFALGISLFFILKPNQALGIYNWGLKKIGRTPIEVNISIKLAAYVYIGSLICWLGYGVAFWLFVNSITTGVDMPVIWGIAAYIVPYQIGYLAVFTPGGIGVRELAMTALLSPYFGGIAAGIAVAARIWNLTIELAASIIGWLIPMPQSQNEQNR